MFDCVGLVNLITFIDGTQFILQENYFVIAKKML